MKSLKLILLIIVALAAVVVTTTASSRLFEQEKTKQTDPVDWGSNHVGKPTPDFYGGDECLFCHRFTVGQVWQKDAHFRSIRGKYVGGKDAPEIEFLKSDNNGSRGASKVEFIMGKREVSRFLRRNEDGDFELLSFGILKPGTDKAKYFDLRWSHGFAGGTFDAACIGCHMTGVDSKTKAPFEPFVGCESCHGPHNPEHTKGKNVYLRFSKKGKDPAQVIASSCGSCHLRGGESRSTGLPYPDNFVSGDNLFKDFKFDFTQSDDPKLNPIDAHIQKNIRDIVIRGNDDVTCLSCHRIHPSDTLRHRRQLKTDYCMICHEVEPFKQIKKFEVHSQTCEY